MPPGLVRPGPAPAAPPPATPSGNAPAPPPAAPPAAAAAPPTGDARSGEPGGHAPDGPALAAPAGPPGAPAGADQSGAPPEPKPAPQEGQWYAQQRAREAALVRQRQEHARAVAEHAAKVKAWEAQQAAILDSLKPPQAPPPVDERLTTYEQRLRTIEEENNRLKQFAQTTSQQRYQENLQREVLLFRGEAENSKDHPLAASMARKYGAELGEMALGYAKADPSLTNIEILGKVEDELARRAEIYGSLRPSAAKPEATQAATSAPPKPAAHPPSGNPGTATAPTLTSVTASERASSGPEKLPSILKLSPAEQTARAIEAARKAKAELIAKRAQSKA